jgi:hypothetical protein
LPTSDDIALPPVNTGLILKGRYGGKDVISPECCGAFKMKRLTNILTLVTTLALLTSCEGFKVLTIQNTSDREAKVTIRPGINYSDENQIHNYPNNLTSDSSVVLLQPDSSITVLSIFTGMMFNVKIKERELRTDYLKIEAHSDTIIANSREEIIDLIYKKRKGSIKGKGRNLATIEIE